MFSNSLLLIHMQMLLGERCGEKADMFSLGVILWEIITGERPCARSLRPYRCSLFNPQSLLYSVSQDC